MCGSSTCGPSVISCMFSTLIFFFHSTPSIALFTAIKAFKTKTSGWFCFSIVQCVCGAASTPFFCLRKFTIWPGKNECDMRKKCVQNNVIRFNGDGLSHNYYYFVCLCLSARWTIVNMWWELRAYAQNTHAAQSKSYRYGISFGYLFHRRSRFFPLQNNAHIIIQAITVARLNDVREKCTRSRHLLTHLRMIVQLAHG